MTTSTTLPKPDLPPGAPGVPKGTRYRRQYGVIVLLEDEAAQVNAFGRLRRQGFKCRVVVT
ncbi:MAG: hypothetical protein KBO60_26835 [Achromobacter sp.]|nr:hypothetical protein [Achromobacter sp.]